MNKTNPYLTPKRSPNQNKYDGKRSSGKRTYRRKVKTLSPEQIKKKTAEKAKHALDLLIAPHHKGKIPSIDGNLKQYNHRDFLAFFDATVENEYYKNQTTQLVKNELPYFFKTPKKQFF